jgi:DNA-binding response OmpR family regulator
MPHGQSLQYKILIVEDDADLCSMLSVCFKNAGHAVLTAATGREAMLAAVDSKPDLVVCDVVIPDMNGFQLCRRLRGNPSTAHIALVLMSGTSKAERDQLEGFSLGADDYVLKPCPPAVLLAKAEAVLRRYASAQELGEVLKADGVKLDVQGRTVSCGHRRVVLTRKEFDLLALLLRKRGRVLTPAFLLESVWGHDLADYNDPHTVTVHLSSLRQKLGPKLAGKIVTVPGTGYRYDP